ncbi:MAG: ATP-binding cassette domain-containing protein [Rhodobacteraceae bacterium]|nr:ATP-binding cassette domain-containing protein [Paracoccaceae bacterium]
MARPPILTLTDISLTFGGDPLLDGLNLAVQPGDRVALVGRNGSGKSTLMKIMAGLIEPDRGARFLTPGLSVGYMEQHPDFTGFTSLGDFAAAALPPGEAYRVEAASEGLKLNLAQDPALASGGERRRAALARILAEAPDLMLLDEPTNHLDIQAIGWLEAHLASTRSAFVLISHDRAFLRALTRATLWVDRGIVRRRDRGFSEFEEWRDQVFAEEDQQRHKLNRLIKAEGRWAVEGISARRTRNQGRLRRLADLRAEHAGQIAREGVARLAIESGPKSGKLVIEADRISKSFDGLPVVEDFSIKITRGERIALIGPNGAGKTTLVNLLIGVLAPDTGRVRLGTGLVTAVFDQNRAALNPNASLWETLTDDAELGVSGKNDQVLVRGVPRHVVGYLKDFLFDEAQARGPVRALSGGERARLLLARLLARQSNLLVLDEPTNDLDVETLDLLQEVLDDYDGTVLLVSHDRDFLDRIATTSIVMDGDGKAVIFAGGWSDYQAQKQAGMTAGTAAKATKPGKPAKKSANETPKPVKSDAVNTRLSFSEQHRLRELPATIARLEEEIARLNDFLGDPDLYASDPAKFAKASSGLIERQKLLAAAEEAWLDLAARDEN